MTTILGRDWGANTLGRFGGRLVNATLHRETSAIDPTDPSQMIVDTLDYVCQGMPFRYEMRDVDGDRIHKGDYLVSLIRKSISSVLDDAVRAALDLSMATINVDSIVEAVEQGVVGNSITIEFVGDASSQPGALIERGTNVRIGFQPGVTTVADVELLVATAALIRLRTAGTPGHVLASGDAFAATALAGGVDASTLQVDVVPTVGDTITIPPPGETTPKTGRIVHIDLLNEAQVTFQVRGAGA